MIRLTLVATIAMPFVAQADFIGFDNLANMTVIGTQYPHVTFSSSVGAANYAYANAGAPSPSNILCTGNPTITCLQDTYLQFDGPVQNLTFYAVEPNFAGHDADFRIFQNGVFTTTVPLFGLGGIGNKFVDLSAYSNITRLEIVNILNDPAAENGIGWDSFSFTPVPEPTSLLGIGLGGLALILHRRNKVK